MGHTAWIATRAQWISLLLEMFGAKSIYRAQRHRDTVILSSDNSRYGRNELSTADFDDHVLARVSGVWKPVS